ncbi:MAG: hypothetical protein RL701_6419, partial [Pseudomonadota bacterium]
GVLNEVDLATHRYGHSSYYYYRNEGYYESDDGGDGGDGGSGGDSGEGGERRSRPVAQA